MYFNRFAIDAIAFICALSICVVAFADNVEAQAAWKEDWEKTLRGAEAEGQLTLYGCCYEYDRILERFKKKYPKIKVTTVLGGGRAIGRAGSSGKTGWEISTGRFQRGRQYDSRCALQSPGPGTY